MISRNLIHSLIRATSTLTLLVSVMTPPLRVSNALAESTSPDHFACNLGIPQPCMPIVHAKLVTSRVLPVKAIQSENDEREPDGDSIPPSCFIILPPSHSHLPFARDLSDFGLSRAQYPLRC